VATSPTPICLIFANKSFRWWRPLFGGVSRPSKIGWTYSRRAYRCAGSEWTPPSERSPTRWSAFPLSRAASIVWRKTGFRKNSPSRIAFDIRTLSW
jgi:hypothetical protein